MTAIDQRLVQELRDMYAIARTVRGWTPDNHPSRLTSEEFTAKLAQLRDEGHNMFAVARALGTTYGTLRARLARHGYKRCPPSLRPYKGRPQQRGGA